MSYAIKLLITVVNALLRILALNATQLNLFQSKVSVLAHMGILPYSILQGSFVPVQVIRILKTNLVANALRLYRIAKVVYNFKL